MRRYERDYGRYDRDLRRGGSAPDAGPRGYDRFRRPRRFQRGLDIGPVWGGGSDIGQVVFPTEDPGYRGRPAPRSGGYDRGYGPPRDPRGRTYDWWYW